MQPYHGAVGIRSFKHAGLRRFWERDDARRVPPDCVERLGSILTGIDDAGSAVDLAGLPGIHRLRGNLAGYWAARVNRHRRVIFRFEDGTARDIDLVDYH